MPSSALSAARVPAAGGWSRWYLPLSQPLASGDQGSSPRPSDWQAGTTSHSMPRASRVYCGCTVTGPGQAKRVGDVHGFLHLPAGEVRQPDIVDLPGPDRVVQEAKCLL